MKSSAYWKKRFEQLEQSQHQKGELCYAEIEQQYRKAQKQIESQIAVWYQRFADNNGVTMQEARRMLNKRELEELKWDVKEYIRYGKENAMNQQWMKQLENASARYHISRLEALKIQTQQSLEVLFGNQLDSLDSAMRDAYKSGYYHTAFEIQKGVGVGWNFATLDEKAISKVINKPWAADGKNFSERVWGNRQKLVNELHTELTRNIVLGQDYRKAIDNIARKMNASKNVTKRLVLTEGAFFNSASRQDCFKELGVEQYEILVSYDRKTCDTCQKMEGKHFPLSQWEVGVTAPPFHVNCRCDQIPYFDDEFSAMGTKAARDENGKTIFIPADMTYKEWEKSFVEGDKTGLQEVEPDANEEDILEYISSKNYYDEQLKHLAELEKESDDLLDAYMDAMDTPDADRLNKLFEDKFKEVEGFEQIVKDLKAQLTGKEAKAVRQIEKNLALKSGIPIDRIEMTGLPYESANMVYTSYKTVLHKYPELKGELAAFEYDGVYGGTYAGCIALTGEIKAHGIFGNYEKIVRQYADDVAAGFHPIGTDHTSVIVHELGHALDGYMTKKNLCGGLVNRYGVRRSCVDIRQEVLAKLGYVVPSRADLKKQGYTYSQINDIIIEDRKDFITKQVSEYAADNEREFFAECFAEYVMSNKPRKAAQIFGEIIDDALGR